MIEDAPMTPARHVGIVLAEWRRRGLPFLSAWNRTLCSLPRTGRNADPERMEWLAALREARPYYEAAYEGRPPPSRPAPALHPDAAPELVAA